MIMTCSVIIGRNKSGKTARRIFAQTKVPAKQKRQRKEEKKNKGKGKENKLLE